MNNFPAMTEERRQELAEVARNEIKVWDDGGHYKELLQIALAALAAEPVAYVHPAYLQPGALGFDASVGRLAPAQVELFTAPPAPVLCSPAYHDEAKRLAELHGMSFVVFRHGEAPAVADPTRVIIGFTDKGLGHDTTGGQQ